MNSWKRRFLSWTSSFSASISSMLNVVLIIVYFLRESHRQRPYHHSRLNIIISTSTRCHITQAVAVTFVRVESCSTCQPNGSVPAPVKGSGNDVQWGKPPMDDDMTWSLEERKILKFSLRNVGLQKVEGIIMFCGSLWGALMLDV